MSEGIFDDPVWEHNKNRTTKRKFFNARQEEFLNRAKKKQEERLGWVGASEVSSILGCNSFKSHRTLWKEKKGIIKPEDGMQKKLNVQLGVYCESGVVDIYNQDIVTKEETKNRWMVIPSGQITWEHSFVEGMRATPDAWGFCEEKEGVGLFDVKVTSGWGVSIKDGKEEWHWQLMHQMACAPVHFDYAAILMISYGSPQGFMLDANGEPMVDENGHKILSGKRYPRLVQKAFIYDRDEEMMQTCEIAVEDFWESIKNNKPPRD